MEIIQVETVPVEAVVWDLLGLMVQQRKEEEREKPIILAVFLTQ
jgi:hypothetical protein